MKKILIQLSLLGLVFAVALPATVPTAVACHEYDDAGWWTDDQKERTEVVGIDWWSVGVYVQQQKNACGETWTQYCLSGDETYTGSWYVPEVRVLGQVVVERMLLLSSQKVAYADADCPLPPAHVGVYTNFLIGDVGTDTILP